MTDPNLPAFPNLSTNGITKREHFAAMAMQGICANSIPGEHHLPNQMAVDAVIFADALISELNRTEDKKHGE